MNLKMSDRHVLEPLGTPTGPLAGMALIPAGPFMMGSDDGGEFEGPVHEVDLGDYYLDETTVTNGMFARYVEEAGYTTDAERAGGAWGYTGSEFTTMAGLCWRSYAGPGRNDHPVVFISWEDASAYARWAGKRLPTEAEWEKGARGNRQGELYPWGGDVPDATRCNFGKAPGSPPPTTRVRQFPANDYGLFDMVGNVWQWCADWFAADTYLVGPRQDPAGPSSGQHRVRRGASWNVIQPFRLCCANRGAFDPRAAVPNLGFRCAWSAQR